MTLTPSTIVNVFIGTIAAHLLILVSQSAFRFIKRNKGKELITRGEETRKRGNAKHDCRDERTK